MESVPLLALPSRDSERGTSVRSESDGEEDSFPGVTSLASRGGSEASDLVEPALDGGQETGLEGGGRLPPGYRPRDIPREPRGLPRGGGGRGPLEAGKGGRWLQGGPAGRLRRGIGGRGRKCRGLPLLENEPLEDVPPRRGRLGRAGRWYTPAGSETHNDSIELNALNNNHTVTEIKNHIKSYRVKTYSK